jgi:hypothetical protein
MEKKLNVQGRYKGGGLRGLLDVNFCFYHVMTWRGRMGVSVRRNVCVYICKCVCIHIHTFIHAFNHSFIHTYMNTYMHTYLYTYIHTYVREDGKGGLVRT